MTKRTHWMVVPTAIALVLAIAGSARSDSTIQIAPNFQPDPITATGQSGGSNKSKDCGYVAKEPNQTVKLTEAMPYLRFSVQSSGTPTLMVDGPGGHFCVLADSYSRANPEISGFWPSGTYTIRVGDRDQGQHSYTLSISKQQK